MISGRSDGPFIDLMKEITPRTGRQYVAVRTAVELGVAGGCLHPDTAVALQERVEALEKIAADYEQLREEHDALLNAVGYTLTHGAVVRNKVIALRSRPGVKSIDL
jgi:hypothetical protein